RTVTVVPPNVVGNGRPGAGRVVVARFTPKATAMDSGASAAPLKLADETLMTVAGPLIGALSAWKSQPMSLPSVPAFLYGLIGARRESPPVWPTKRTTSRRRGRKLSAGYLIPGGTPTMTFFLKSYPGK